MSFVQRILEALDARLWKFIRIVHSANRDYPYHDYFFIENETGEDLNGCYAVGSSNVDLHGDQSKRFVSKRALIWSDGPGTTITLNDSRNTPIMLKPDVYDGVAQNWMVCSLELHTNINTVFYHLHSGQTLCMYFEGVLPEEARDAE